MNESLHFKNKTSAILGRNATIFSIFFIIIAFYLDRACCYVRGHGGRHDKHALTNNFKSDVIDMDSLMDIHFSHLAEDSPPIDQMAESPASESKSNVKTSFNSSRQLKTNNYVGFARRKEMNAGRHSHISKIHSNGVNSESRVKLTSNHHRLIDNLELDNGPIGASNSALNQRTSREEAHKSSNISVKHKHDPKTIPFFGKGAKLKAVFRRTILKNYSPALGEVKDSGKHVGKQNFLPAKMIECLPKSKLPNKQRHFRNKPEKNKNDQTLA